MNIKNVIFLPVIAAAALSCASVSMKTPDGFVLFDKEDNFRAVSSDNVYIKTALVEEKGAEANADLDTWAAELSRSFQAKGYIFVKKTDIAAAAGTGKYCEYEVVFNGETYIYAITLFRKGDRLFYAETGGRKDYFDAKRTKIMDAVKTADLQ